MAADNAANRQELEDAARALVAAAVCVLDKTTSEEVHLEARRTLIERMMEVERLVNP